ncbi:MAG: glutamate--tRNA ligase [Myxococcales bacterium]|nr:glutamate--tRNA ligase [Myxococcales bacterium]
MANDPVRTRFAPSPTGSLHVGGVRTALYCLLVARSSQGQYLLRIEDTDRTRSTEEAAAGILSEMAWLGLPWDEGPGVAEERCGPFYQSQRLDLYRRHAAQLLEQGHAYEAWETPAELDAMRKEAEAKKANFRYRRIRYTDEQLQRFADEGRTPVLRFASPPGEEIVVRDEILGNVVADDIDDFVIVKADGFPTYHFAVVVDDHHMDISLVLRGQEHLKNTHKHVLIYRALGWEPPRHAHLPLIVSAGGPKLGKRDKAKAARKAAREAHAAGGHPKGDYTWLAEATGLSAEQLAPFMAKKADGVTEANAIAQALGVDLPMVEVLDFRRAGYLPEALVNYLVLLGWSPGDDREILTFDEMVEAFTVDRINKTPAQFDTDKLAWMNGQYMQQLPTDVLLSRLSQWLEVTDSPISGLDDAARRALVEMYRPRARTFRDIDRLGAFFFEAPTEWAPKQVKKHVEKGDGWERLQVARRALGELDTWDVPTLRGVFETLCAGTELGIGKFAQPVRVAVTGTGVSPELFDTIALLGRDATLQRIDAFLATRGS